MCIIGVLYYQSHDMADAIHFGWAMLVVEHSMDVRDVCLVGSFGPF